MEKQHKLKIAILHDDFSICGGGERLIAILVHALKKDGIKVDIFSWDISKETKKAFTKGLKIRTIKNNRFPFNVDGVKRYLFSIIKLKKKYDFFIFSGHYVLPTAKFYKPNLFYCNNIFPSIMKRGLIGASEEEIRRTLNLSNNPFHLGIWPKLCKIKKKIIKKPIPKKISTKLDEIRFWLAKKAPIYSDNIRFWLKYRCNQGVIEYLTYSANEEEYIKHIDKIIVNSQNIKNKVKKYYERDSVIIYPPVDTKKYNYKKSKNFWISVNRIIPAKRIELQLNSFSKIPDEKLYVIGHFENKEYYEKLKRIKPNNVEFLGVLYELELIKKLSECKGMIFTAKDEDFGMVIVEAMASGKPVIAPNEGGCKETIINEKTGILLNNIDVNNIAGAVKQINKELKNNPLKYKDDCMEQAKKFDIEIFVKKMKKEIKDQIATRST